jgi:transposase
MPNQRGILQELDQNVRRKPNLSKAQRDEAVGMFVGGAPPKEIAEYFDRTPQGIGKILKKYHNTGTTQDKPRPGRPKLIDRHQSKLIYRAVRKDPKIEYEKLREVAQVFPLEAPPLNPPSRSTLYRELKGLGLTNHRCKKRPKLDRGHALKRLQFCREYRNFRWRRRPLKFSDKCSLQKGSGANQSWCFRFLWEKWDPKMIEEVPTGRAPQQMVWGSIWLDERGSPRRSNLVIMERDSNAPKGGYSAQSYIEALTEGLLPHYRRSQLFMQDGAGIHRSRAVREFLDDHHVNTIDWPPYSPDLNPIEHLWWILKRDMHQNYPQFNNWSKAQSEWEAFCEALKECWRAIPGSLIKSLILSMPDRIEACYTARGYQTKY